jgi:biopolymer transport protein ExbD
MVVINMDKKCNIFINKNQIVKENLIQKLKEYKEIDKKSIFQIGADSDSKHACMVLVLDALSQAQIENISILTKKAE